jgi:eukaryotic-like serine/threonine-protein kinase
MTDGSLNPDERERQLDAIIAEYYRALEQGWRPNHVEWLSEYPEFETELRGFFADIALMPKPGESHQPDPALAATLIGPFPATSSGENKFPVFANYEVLEEIGRGGMGIVYRARQHRPNRLVAIKMMRKGRFASRDDTERFLNEANAASQLDADAVVPVYEVSDLAGEPFIVMKYIDGKCLQQLLNENTISFRNALAKLRQIARCISKTSALGSSSARAGRDMAGADFLWHIPPDKCNAWRP